MDKRLIDVIACPKCLGELRYIGKSDGQRLVHGELQCADCGLAFSVEDDVPNLVVPETDLDWANWEREEGIEKLMAEWVSRNFNSFRTPNGLSYDPYLQDFVNTLHAIDGPIIDIASGPGGSWCVPAMEHGNTDGLFVMSDLGKPVVKAWHNHLREVGWANRCSLMVFDARRMPFKNNSIAAITSIGGLGSVKGDKHAYGEAARVLHPNGRLLDMIKLFEEGGSTQKKLKEEQAATTWSDYEMLLHKHGFIIERWGVSSSGKGKAGPEDEYTQDNETWECRMVNAVRL